MEEKRKKIAKKKIYLDEKRNAEIDEKVKKSQSKTNEIYKSYLADLDISNKSAKDIDTDFLNNKIKQGDDFALQLLIKIKLDEVRKTAQKFYYNNGGRKSDITIEEYLAEANFALISGFYNINENKETNEINEISLKYDPDNTDETKMPWYGGTIRNKLKDFRNRQSTPFDRNIRRVSDFKTFMARKKIVDVDKAIEAFCEANNLGKVARRNLENNIHGNWKQNIISEAESNREKNAEAEIMKTLLPELLPRLTKLQKEIIDRKFGLESFAGHKQTLDEIKEAMNFKSKQNVEYHLKKAQKIMKEYIEKNYPDGFSGF